MKVLKKELNKWQYGISFEKSSERDDGYFVLMIWFLNFISFLELGECIRKKNYKGILLSFNIRSPIYKNGYQEGFIIRFPKIVKR